MPDPFRRLTDRGGDLWLRDLIRGAEQRLTTDASASVAPFWSPNGDYVVFASNRSGFAHEEKSAVRAAGGAIEIAAEELAFPVYRTLAVAEVLRT